MIDFEAMEIYIKARTERLHFVFPGNLITIEEIKKLEEMHRRLPKTELMMCFAPRGDSAFVAEIECERCKKTYHERFGSDAFKRYFRREQGDNNYFCLVCKCQLEEEKESKSKDMAIESERLCNERTKAYIDSYLDPNRSWSESCKKSSRMSQIRDDWCYLDNNAIESHILGMDYQDFLQTPYWRAITDHMKYKCGYRCQLCNVQGNLATHHRTYEIHGKEHLNLKELIVLCDDCHSKHHDKE